MIRTIALIATGLLLALAAVACGDDDGGDAPSPTPPPATEQPVDTPEPGPTLEPTPGSTPEESPPAGEIADLARVILQAARDNRLDLLEELGRFAPVPCTDIVEGIGGPPQCRDGEADGTPVQVMLAASCEGYYVREGELTWENFELAAGNGVPVHGVYRVTSSNITQGWPAAEYVFVLREVTPGGQLNALALFTDTVSIVGFMQACGQSPEQFVETQGLTDIVIEPGTAN